MKIRKYVLTLIFIIVAALLTKYSDYIGDSSGSVLATSTETRLHFLDVGQADCTLIESGGEYLLIDAGDSTSDSKIINYLNNLNIENIDYVIATHPHADHIGSMDNVINDFNVKNIILPDAVATTKTYNNMLDAVEDNNVNAIKADVGDKYSFGECSFEIICPYEIDEENLNNSSVGIILTHGNNKMLFMGDGEAKVEEQIIASGRDLNVDLYKVSHHGSRTSSSEKFISLLSPEYSVISCGKDNDYGHPHSETISTLEKYGSKIYRTDQCGDIVITSLGNGFRVDKGFISGTSFG